MKFTKTSVEKLEATDKRYSQFDDDLKGFAVRVGTSGDKAFYYVYRAGKGRGAALKWLRLGTFPTISVEQARAIAKQKAAAVALGADPAQEIREGKAVPLMKAALETFFTEHVEAKLKPASRRQYRYLIDHNIIPAIGKLQVSDVEHRHIATLHHAMRATPYLANRAYSAISKFFSWAKKNGYRPRGNNPAVGVEKYKEHKRTTFMGAQELTQLGAALDELEQAWHDRERAKEHKEKWDSTIPLITPQAASVRRAQRSFSRNAGEHPKYSAACLVVSHLPGLLLGVTPSLSLLQAVGSETSGIAASF